MATQEKGSMCENLLQKLTTGKSLDEAEKTHLAVCENCLLQLVKMLDESATSKSPDSSSAGEGRNGDATHARPEAMKALEHGRRVFEREFGISLPKK
jgi:hypothetical protein